MKAKFWIEEKSPLQVFEEFIKSKNSNLTLWNVFTNYNPIYREDKRKYDGEDIEEFDYPTIDLAYSNTFYDFNDAGYLSYEEQEEFANKKFVEYKNEISDLLKQDLDDKLLPKLDYTKLNANDELENQYWLSIETNPFMHNFEGDFAVWKGEEKVLFLSVLKEDKELHYEIHLGGLTLEKYSEILKKFNKITE